MANHQRDLRIQLESAEQLSGIRHRPDRSAQYDKLQVETIDADYFNHDTDMTDAEILLRDW